MRHVVVLATILLAAPVWADGRELEERLKRLADNNEKLVSTFRGVKDRKTAEGARKDLDRIAEDRAKIKQEIAGTEWTPAERRAAEETIRKALGPGDSAVVKEVARISLIPDALEPLDDQPIVKEAANSPEQRARIQVIAVEKAVKTFMIKNDGQAPMALSEVARYLVDPKAGLTDPWGRALLYDPTGKQHGGKEPDIWVESPFGGGKKPIGNWDQKR
jgi:hypothetical protein